MIRPLETVEKIAVLSAIVEIDFDVQDAANKLGISSRTIYRLLKRWELFRPKGKGISPRAIKAALDELLEGE